MTLAQALKLKGGATARGRRPRHEQGEMNGLERRYASEVLAPQLAAGEILWWGFECLKLRLAKGCYYDTDFLVVAAGGELQVHEVKGHMEDDAAVKLRVAAELFPLPIYLCTHGSEGWKIKEY